MTQWPFAYAPGGSWVLCGPRLAVLVPADVAPEVLARVRRVVADPTRVLDEALEALIADGLRTAPDFGILQPGPQGTRVVVRGGVTARLGERAVSGTGLWTDTVGEPGAAASLALPSVEGDSWLPLAAGQVLADAVAEAAAVRQPPVDAAPPEVEVASGSGHTLPGVLISPTPQPEPTPAPDPTPTPEPTQTAPVAPEGEPTERLPLTPGVPTAGPDAIPSVTCLRGHLNPPLASLCRVCGDPIPPQPPVRLPRPALGVLRFVNGDEMVLDQNCVLGRNPRVPDGSVGEPPRLVRLNDPDKDVSSQHLALTLDGWEVSVRDLGSTNGTEVTLPGRLPQPLLAGQSLTIVPGTVLVLAGVLTVTFEAPPS